MRKITFAINYRKPKAEYDKNDYVEICIRYSDPEHDSGKLKIRNISCGIKCKLKDWNKDWHKSPERLSILKTDPDFSKKNKKLFELRKKILVNEFDNTNNIRAVKSTSSKLNSNIPGGPIESKWTNHKNNINLVNPANKRNSPPRITFSRSD